MSQHLPRKMATVWIGILLVTNGCDERVVEVSREAANRQAEQNREMVRLQQHVAESTHSLVEADANARRDFVAVHRDLQSERKALDRAWSGLEKERGELAKVRSTESLLVQAIPVLGWFVLLAALLGFLRQLLHRPTETDAIDAELNELLIQELLESPATGDECDPSSLASPPATNLLAARDK